MPPGHSSAPELIGSDLHRLCSVYKRSGDIFAVRRGIRLTTLKHRWGAIKSVMQDAYWGRLWIIQELVLAKQLRILAGSCVVEWEAIVELAEQQRASDHASMGARRPRRNL